MESLKKYFKPNVVEEQLDLEDIIASSGEGVSFFDQPVELKPDDPISELIPD